MTDGEYIERLFNGCYEKYPNISLSDTHTRTFAGSGIGLTVFLVNGRMITMEEMWQDFVKMGVGIK